MNKDQLELLNNKQQEIDKLTSHINQVKAQLAYREPYGNEEKPCPPDQVSLRLGKYKGEGRDWMYLENKYFSIKPYDIIQLYLKKCDVIRDRLQVEMESIVIEGI